MDVLNFLQNNTGWIKDLVSLTFAATATVLAIMTYRRAKASILQPMRNEVIKRQTEYLTEILELINKSKNDLDFGLNYVGLFTLNFEFILNEYTFEKLEENRIIQEGKSISRWIQFLNETSKEEYVYIIWGEKEYIETYISEERKLLYKDKAKVGDCKIHRIFITKKHDELLDQLKRHSNNSFLPKNILGILNNLVRDIKYNTHIVLREIELEFIKNYSSDYFSNKNDYEKVFLMEEYRHKLYRDFLNRKKSHEDSLEKLKKEIRIYLRIDEGWL